MSMRYKGGVISATGPTVSATVASGIWTNQSVVQLTGAGTWPRVPGAPTIGTATAGNATASVTFTAPSDTGSAAITSYTVRSTPGSITGTGAASPITVTGLTNNTSYVFVALAVNGAGTGPASAASNSVTPSAPPAWILAYYSSSVEIKGGPLFLNSSQVLTPLGQAGFTGGNLYYSLINVNAAGSVTAQQASYRSSFDFQLADGARCTYDQTNNYLYFPVFYNGVGQIGFVKQRPSASTTPWAKTLSLGSGANSGTAWSMAVDPSTQNAYGVGFLGKDTCCGGFTVAVMAAYDSGGTLLWFNRYWGGYDGTSNAFRDVTLNSSGYPVVVGYLTAPGSRAVIYSFAYGLNSVVWSRQLYTGGVNLFYTTVAKDSSYNYYAAGYISTTGKALLVKYDSSGTLQWQRSLTVATGSLVIYKARVDSSNNLYLLGSTGESNNPCYLIKYDSSDTIVWQRVITASFNLASGNADFVIDETDGRLLINFGTAGASGLTTNGMKMVVKYPTDGSITGSYALGSSTVTIAASSATQATTTYIDGATGSYGNPTSYTTSTTSYTYTTISNSSSLTNL